MIRKTVSVRAAAVAAVCLISANASAEKFWNIGDGDISDLANYSDSGDLNVGYYNVGNNATVSLATGGSFDPGRLRIGHSGALFPGPATFNMTGGTLTPGGLNQANPDGTNAGLTIGLNNTGIMNQSGGLVTSTRFVIIGADGTNNNTGPTPGSGTLNLSGTAEMRSTNNDVIVGLGNPGTLTVADTAILSVVPTLLTSTQNPSLTIGTFSTSTYSQSGGTVNVANSMQISSGSTGTLSSGTITTRFKNAANGFPTVVAPNGNFVVGISGTPTFTQTGGTLNVGNQMSIGTGTAVGATYTISGASIVNTNTAAGTGNGNITVGAGTATGSTMNINGGTITNGGRFLVGGGTSTGNVVNHTSGSLTMNVNFVVGDVGGGMSTYNFSGGTITTNSELSRVGRQGNGSMFQSGGTADFKSGLAVGDDTGGGTSSLTGVYEISSGSLLTGLVTGQTGAALRVGTSGVGTLRVVGDDGIVDVNGDFLLGNTAKGAGTLAYRFKTGDSLSVLDVSGAATFSSGSALALDTSVAAPTQAVYDVLTAASIADSGLVITPGWARQIVAGGNGKLLQVAQVRSLYWDTDGTTAGAGGTSPSGAWDGTTPNFTADASGASTTVAPTTFADDVTFTAGADGTGSYNVIVSGAQAANSVLIARGDVTLTGGTLAVGTFDVATGATGTVSSSVSGNASGTVTKTGPGSLTLSGVNTHTGGTTVNGGTLVVANADALGTGGITIDDTTSAVAQASLPKAVSVASVTTSGTGKLDLTNNALVVKSSTLAAVDDLVTAGYNNGDWLGGGITSSTAATDPNGLTAIGFFDNAEFGATEFEGVSNLDSDDVIVKYTYYGDADLNGIVDPDDFNQFLAGFQDNTLPRTWLYGDFDYNNVIDPDDFNLFLAAFQFNGAPLSELVSSIEMSSLSSADQQLLLGAVAAVPEPTSLAVLGLAACGLAARRRKH